MQRSILSKKMFTLEEINWYDNLFGLLTNLLSKNILQTIYISIYIYNTHQWDLRKNTCPRPKLSPLPLLHEKGVADSPIATLINRKSTL